MNEPEHAVQFPVPWSKGRPKLRCSAITANRETVSFLKSVVPVVKMTWRNGRFTITYADGERWSTDTPTEYRDGSYPRDD